MGHVAKIVKADQGHIFRDTHAMTLRGTYEFERDGTAGGKDGRGPLRAGHEIIKGQNQRILPFINNQIVDERLIIWLVIILQSFAISFPALAHRGGEQVANMTMYKADAPVTKNQKMLGCPGATSQIVGGYIVAVKVGQVAVDKHERIFLLLELEQCLVIGNIANGKDDQSIGDRPQSGNIKGHDLGIFFGIGEAHLVATRLRSLLNPAQDAHVQSIIDFAQDDADTLAQLHSSPGRGTLLRQGRLTDKGAAALDAFE